jgi:predicted tellurium resistance membrane protein TerC
MDSAAPTQRDMKAFLLHLVVYGSLLLLYFALVLRYGAAWLLGLFHQHRTEYALAAILLMIGQAVGLEIVSHFVLRLIRRKKA